MTIAPLTMRKLGDPEIAQLVMGQSPASETYNTGGEGLPFYQGKADFGLLHPRPRVWCSEPLRIAESLDTLVSVRAPVGDVNLSNGRCCLGCGVAAIRASESLNPIFLYFAMASAKERLASVSTGTTFESINKTALEDLEIPFPRIGEQQRIAALLWKLHRAFETEGKLVATARELKQSAMRQIFVVGLQGETLKQTEVGQIPLSWRVCRLSDIAVLERGRFLHRPRNEPRFYGGDTPFVQTGDVVRSQGWIREYKQTLNDAGVAISRVFPKGTILITIAANIGYTGVLEFDSACPDSLVGITPHESVDAWFLEYCLQTQQADMDRLAPKGTQKNINIQFLAPWQVAIPPLNEQLQIAQIMRAIDRKIALHEHKRAALQELFQALLYRLMTGEIRVADLDIDVSEVTQ